ncbi:uncharacterized protein K452DRAFT_262959 [Aplosporella prunicola CBS 121167]|uniref:PhoD-like phosphatase domain-containing protein n=1 Tax=Aplosporella prunicola CBS 121167 TaxID=1176127 RepID=A0A6A6BVU9_9PEZI|nr:uncharacterized protein K452DRAFT_262959 [Aplosporella prunicola CBS 121167]KAF2146821.1 hypothetical protein K452DRAFT_262959 [Aplosporella prunicola CBS 121167]
MDARRNSASAPRKPIPEDYHAQDQPDPYRRRSKQSQAARMDHHTYPASKTSARSNSNRRRSNHSYPTVDFTEPPQPEASRAPPVSYKEPYKEPYKEQPYMGSFAAPARSRSHKRYEPAPARVRSNSVDEYISSSSRPYEPATIPPQVNVNIPPANLYDDSLLQPQAPASPSADYGERVVSSETTGSGPKRKGSVSNRSPLQKLEGALGGINKETRRAMIVDAEGNTASKHASRDASREVPIVKGKSRYTSGPEPTGSERVVKPNGKRDTVPNDEYVDARYPHRGPIDPGPSYRPEQQDYPAATSRGGSQRKARVPQYDGPVQHKRGYSRDRAAPDTGKPASFRDRTAQAGPSTVYHETQSRDYAEPAAVAGGTGLGLSGMNDHSENERSPTKVGRSNSRRLQKRGGPPEVQQSIGSREPAKMSGAHKQMASDRAGHSHGAKAAAKYDELDPLPAEAVKNPYASTPKYEVPPQTAGGQQAREQVGFSREDPAMMAPGHENHRHLPNLFHRHHRDDRRYMAQKPLEEWRHADTANLTTEDIDIDDAAQVWAERSRSQRRGHGSQAKPGASHYDGTHEQPQGQTHFTPPLYMKCGPLLRYRGMRRISRMGRSDKWIWRGSVMIVTIDNFSSYEKTPTLRLFVQSKELMSPPPADLSPENSQDLPQEYVDPLAGETKVSRTGKTLYVRPVEDLEAQVDLSRREDDSGLFELSRSAPLKRNEIQQQQNGSRHGRKDGEKAGKYREVKGHRLLAERGVTFWRFNLEVELGKSQARLAYRINKGPAIGFWVPARGETMNIMFHSCNGFSLSVDSNMFSGPDPLWRDVLNNHQTKPFHVMLGGGDQIYNDASTKQTRYFQEWLGMKNPAAKHSAEFTAEMQDELEEFYLNRYAMWFSQGFFGMANSQIPMVNVWDDHDIIDGYGSYPHHFMKNAVFCGLGAIAFKYYMLFQHQSLVDETEVDEPSWLLGSAPGPYINEVSRNLFMFLGKSVAFLGLDCRTERMRDEILSAETYYAIFDRCRKEIVKGETKHLIVLLGVPIAYPRLNFLENVLTSRVMDPIKALGRTGMLGGFVNKFDGGVEILDDLDDHWTAKHHKAERNWFIQELQELASEKSVRITILGGDVHLAAVGQFYSNKKLGIPKDHDHRYMPNIISSAIVNTPPPELMGDILNKRNKIHHLDDDTDEDMIPMFTNDVDGKPRNNHHLLPRRNWCSLREYKPGTTPPLTRTPSPDGKQRPGGRGRSLSFTRSGGPLTRRFSNKGGPPPAMYNTAPGQQVRSNSAEAVHHPHEQHSPPLATRATGASFDAGTATAPPPADPPRPNPFHRVPTGLSLKAARKGGALNEAEQRDAGAINLEGGLDIVLNLEVNQKDPAGITAPYRLLVPALSYRGALDVNVSRRKKSLWAGLLGKGRVPNESRSVSPESDDSATAAAAAGGKYGGDAAHAGGHTGRGGPHSPPLQVERTHDPVVYGSAPVQTQTRRRDRRRSYGDEEQPRRRYDDGGRYDDGRYDDGRYDDGRYREGGSASPEGHSFEEGEGRPQQRKKKAWKIWR